MGIISKENKKALAALIDGWTPYKNPVLEGADGFVYSMVIGALDDNFLSKVKPEYHQRIDQAIGEFASEDFDAAAMTIGDILADAVKTPLIDGTPEEEELYQQALKTLASLIQMWISRSKE